MPPTARRRGPRSSRRSAATGSTWRSPPRTGWWPTTRTASPTSTCIASCPAAVPGRADPTATADRDRHGEPTPPPRPRRRRSQTIRGDQAFVQGTANDLYLACTKLDLYLVDVLPAGRRVSVTGAADLRLVGQSVDILLDGRKVGSTVVGAERRVRREGPRPRARQAAAGALPGEGRRDRVAEAAPRAPDGRHDAHPQGGEPRAARHRQRAAGAQAARRSRSTGSCPAAGARRSRSRGSVLTAAAASRSASRSRPGRARSSTGRGRRCPRGRVVRRPRAPSRFRAPPTWVSARRPARAWRPSARRARRRAGPARPRRPRPGCRCRRRWPRSPA